MLSFGAVWIVLVSGTRGGLRVGSVDADLMGLGATIDLVRVFSVGAH